MISVDNLACQRGGRTILAGVSFKAANGAAIVLRGPNGSGKTTLLRTLAGFLTAESGSVVLSRSDGAAIPRDEASEALHYIGHANGVKPRLSVFENIVFWQRYYSSHNDAEGAEAALEAFGLLHLASYRAAHLSQGQARRLGLARLLAAKRPIWLLDEPSVSLDTSSTRMLEAAIADHLTGGGIAIVSTHLDLNLPNTSILHLDGGSAQTSLR